MNGTIPNKRNLKIERPLKLTEEEKIIKEIEKAKQVQLLALADHCKEDLFFLANDILDYKLMTEKVHRPLTAVL